MKIEVQGLKITSGYTWDAGVKWWINYTCGNCGIENSTFNGDEEMVFDKDSWLHICKKCKKYNIIDD